MEGPQFSSLAESRLYQNWNCDVIGMTNMPEAKLAREAEICYATVAMVTDYDCWHPDHDHVTVEMIMSTLVANAEKARSLVKLTAAKVSKQIGHCPCGCQTALEHALITPREARDPNTVSRLEAVAGRVLNR
jgi:5'-methylthioadenosine phosphorylase